MMAEDNDDRAIELTIEALTGTVYDLCVSPYETILGIKLKVQRLEGIPVYQQQLVWAGLELQDEFCLEEYCIPSGAQLKLLVAMRGGPIHAQRVQVDLEDPMLLEIADLLDSQAGDKYTLMLLRNGDDLDRASFVQVQMLEEDDAMRLSPIHVSEPQHLSVAASKAVCAEHAVTRDKMKELMAKFKKDREFRQAPPPMPSQVAGTQLSRKGTGKVLILESRAPSRLLQNSSSRVTPLSSAHAKESRLTQRKLVFPGDNCPRLHQSGKPKKRMASCSLASRRMRSPEEVVNQPCSRLSEEIDAEVAFGAGSRVQQRLDADDTDCMQSPPKRMTKANLSGKTWHKPSKRKRRSSSGDSSASSLAAAAVGDISCKLSQLDLKAPSLPPITQSPVSESRDRVDFLPPIVRPHLPGKSCNNPKSLSQPLPSLSIATASKQQDLSIPRKKRCMTCGKKTGLASTYSCRCGGIFCAMHRYAETHACTFDYKAEGRQVLARTNPVVAAQKLPKI